MPMRADRNTIDDERIKWPAKEKETAVMPFRYSFST